MLESLDVPTGRDLLRQILAVEYAKKTDEEIDQQLLHDGSMSWAGITFGGKFNKNDVKRYIEELRTKLNVSTVTSNEFSTVLASGDPEMCKLGLPACRRMAVLQ